MTTHKNITCDGCGDTELVDVSHVSDPQACNLRKRAGRIAGWAWISDAKDLICKQCFDELNPFVIQ